MERKLRYIEAEVKKDGVPIEDNLTELPRAPNPREIIDLEVRPVGLFYNVDVVVFGINLLMFFKLFGTFIVIDSVEKEMFIDLLCEIHCLFIYK